MARLRGSGQGWDEFALLYDEHHTRLYRVALLVCHGQRAVAEDAVAETFIKVYEVWSRGEIENFFAYARQTLVSHVIGLHRRRQVADAYLKRVGPTAVAAGAATIEDRVTASSATFELLGQLPTRQRMALVLRYYEDLSYEQVAETMLVSVGTVKAQISVGLSRLRTLMTAESA